MHAVVWKTFEGSRGLPTCCGPRAPFRCPVTQTSGAANKGATLREEPECTVVCWAAHEALRVNIVNFVPLTSRQVTCGRRAFYVTLVCLKRAATPVLRSVLASFCPAPALCTSATAFITVAMHLASPFRCVEQVSCARCFGTCSTSGST